MMAGDFDIERDAAAPDAAVEEPELVAISCIARPSPRKKWILAAVATVLLIAAVAAGLGAGLSNGKGEEETNPTTGTKDPPSRETAALPSPSLPANVSETAGSGIVPNATDPVSSVADSPTSANANALMTSYNIFWKETASKCYAKNKEHLARIECPSLMLFYNGDNCEAIDEKSIVCSGEEVGKTGVVEVACVGTTIDELLVDVNVAGSTYVCNESERDVSSNGLQFTQYVDGTVSQITTVLAKDCDEQPPLSCSGTYSLKVGDDAFKGCGSMMKCANSKTCLIGFPTSCFGLYCQDSLDDVQYQVAGLSDQCTSPFSIGAIPNGESCEYNVECSSKVCSFGTCQDPLIDEAACEESSDCSSQACAYKDASYTERICCLDGEATTSSSGAAVCLGSADAGADCDGQNAICKDNTCAYVDYDRQETVCCGSGSFKYKQCSVCGESDYCLNQAPTGASCGTLDQMCESEVCAGAKCQAGKLSAGEGCNNAEDCLSGSCGIVDYNGRNDRTAKVCCASGSFKYKQCSVCGESDYCLNQAPTGASCGTLDQMCESEVCAGAKCQAGKLSAGEGCNNAEDCLSGSCGIIDYNGRNDRTAKVCCASGSFKYKQCSVCGESDYCLNQAPTGASCGTLDQMCESEVCAGAKCQAGKWSAGEGCNNAEDCLSGSCGIVDYNGRNDRTAKVCCASGSFKYKQCSVCGESDYCLKQAPTGASCGKQGNVPRMCESETCKNGFCK